jgi:hypothetical protein
MDTNDADDRETIEVGEEKSHKLRNGMLVAAGVFVALVSITAPKRRSTSASVEAPDEPRCHWLLAANDVVLTCAIIVPLRIPTDTTDTKAADPPTSLICDKNTQREPPRILVHPGFSSLRMKTRSHHQPLEAAPGALAGQGVGGRGVEVGSDDVGPVLVSCSRRVGGASPRPRQQHQRRKRSKRSLS